MTLPNLFLYYFILFFKMLTIVCCGNKIVSLSLWYNFKIIYYEQIN